MSGGIFNVSGATGQAANTAYFPYMPNHFNMLNPFRKDNTTGYLLSFSAANLGNQWDIWNTVYNGGANVNTCSFGATTTAPDGTSNAQKIVEATNNGYHLTTAGLRVNGNRYGGRYRFSAFAKAAERTRLQVFVGDDARGVNRNSYAKAIFDLSGGQIGVAPTQGLDNDWTALDAKIYSWPNGWYRCDLDFIRGTVIGDGTYFVSLVLDSGTGTGAESTSYVGNGSSGLYVWRTTMLPLGAWSMSGQQTFFDDFDDISTIDLDDTRVPGFKWYVHGAWPNPIAWSSVPRVPKANISVASSILTITNPTHGFFPMMTAASTGGASYVGQVFQAPGLFEVSMAYSEETLNTGTAAWWTSGINTLTDATAVFYGVNTPYTELDFFEDHGGAAPLYPTTSCLRDIDGHGSTSAQDGARYIAYGIPLWQNWISYTSTFSVVNRLGTNYICINTVGNVNKPPESEPTFWSVWVQPATLPPVPALNSNIMHTYSLLWIPKTHADDFGHAICFYEGNFCQYTGPPSLGITSGQASWSPTGNYRPGGFEACGTTFQLADGQDYPIMIQPNDNGIQFDWISVRK